MKATTKAKTPLYARVCDAAAQAWERPAVRQILLCGGILLASFLVAAVSVAGSPLPMAACLAAAVTFWPQSAFAVLGSCLGYWLHWGVQGALEPIAIAILVFAGSGIFHDTRLPAADWFSALLCAGLTAAVGFVFLLDTGLSALTLALFVAKVCMAALTPLLCRQAFEHRQTGAYLACSVLVLSGLGASFAPFGFCVATAICFCVAVSSARIGLLPTLLCAIALDMSRYLGCSVTAGLCGGALLCRLLPNKSAPMRAAVLTAAATAWTMLFGVLSLPFLGSAVVGSVAGIFLPLPWQARELALPQTLSGCENQLRKASHVFAMMHRELSDIPPIACQTEISDIYDFTAEQVCRLCVNYQSCWQTHAEETYHALCDAAVPIMRRGSAVREDFPPQFVDGCRHMEGFITAVNQELDANLSRRQLRSRLQESRRILSNQYLFFSRFLGTLSQEADLQNPPRFAPDFAVASRCRAGNTVSGDRGASFHDRNHHYCVLLCDGMGSGEQAAQESTKAVRILTGLLESGVQPDSAMEILNDFYVLQDCSVFSTVDLLRVDLDTGCGTLYKWGAPPSYLRVNGEVQKIGTSSPPPGIGVGSDHTAQQLKLSLRDGETLVIVSDGAFGEDTQARIAAFRGSTSRELATYLSAARSECADDLTAAVLRLVPGSS